MITRVRFEASNSTEDGLQDDLVGAAAFVQETFGGEWQQERPPQVQTAGTDDTKRFWGYYVLVRK